MEYKYSVIIPHYNMPSLLERLVSSIPLRDDIQIIVVDDCSPNSEKYLSLYKFLNRDDLSFIISDYNGGGGHARNVGLKYAIGKWVLFADSDDFFTPGAFDIFDKYYDTDKGVVYFNIKSVLSDDVTKVANRSDSKAKLFADYAQTGVKEHFKYNHPEPWSKMIRRKMLVDNNIKFDETRVSNDYFFSIKIAYFASDVEIVNEAVYVVTLREDSVSTGYADTNEKLFIRLGVATNIQHFLDEHNVALKPMPMRGLMVILLKRDKILFFKTLWSLHSDGINILKLIFEIFNPRYMSRKKS